MTDEKIIEVLERLARFDDIVTYMENHSVTVQDALLGAVKLLKQEPCEDCISRQAVLEGVDTYINKAQSTGTQDDFNSFAELVVKALPPVMSQPKTAHWIHFANSDDCSGCGWSTGKYISPSDYCPKCGAKMIEPAESEE